MAIGSVTARRPNFWLLLTCKAQTTSANQIHVFTCMLCGYHLSIDGIRMLNHISHQGYVSKGHRFTVDFSSATPHHGPTRDSIPLSCGSLCLGQWISLYLVWCSQTTTKAVWLSETSRHHCSEHSSKINRESRRSANNIILYRCTVLLPPRLSRSHVTNCRTKSQGNGRPDHR